MPTAWNSKCKACGSEHAYEAFSSQECALGGCANFTERQRDAVEAELEAIDVANREYDLAQNDAGPEDADTEPPGPPDPDPDDTDPDDTDPYIWAQPPYAVPVPKAPPKAVAPAPKKKDADKQTDIDTYFDIPWSDPTDMSLD